MILVTIKIRSIFFLTELIIIKIRSFYSDDNGKIKIRSVYTDNKNKDWKHQFGL